MELYERRIDLVEVEENKEVEMEVIHFKKELEDELKELGLNVLIDETDRIAFYTYHNMTVSVGVYIDEEYKGEYTHRIHAHIYGTTETDFNKLGAVEISMLEDIRKVIKKYQDK